MMTLVGQPTRKCRPCEDARVRLAWLALLLVACGGDLTPARLALVPADDLVIVAHQDDDLLFMQPDIRDIVEHHRPLTVVYVTAGDNQSGLAYAQGRYRALRAAYSQVAGARDWGCQWIKLARHAAELCRLGSVSLVFLGYPDGGMSGEWQHSLLKLWDGVLQRAPTVAKRPATYTRKGLIATLEEIVEITRPTVIRTLEVAATHGPDHSDHMIVGALTAYVVMTAAPKVKLLAYRGYSTMTEPANEDFERSSLMMRAYSACVSRCGVCEQRPCDRVEDPRFDQFVRRRYIVGSRVPPFEGRLQLGDKCLGRGSKLVPCDQAVRVAFLETGEVRAGDECLLGDCGRKFMLDEEGHLFVGQVIRGASLYEHIACVFVEGYALRVDRCGGEHATRWTLASP